MKKETFFNKENKSIICQEKVWQQKLRHTNTEINILSDVSPEFQLFAEEAERIN